MHYPFYNHTKVDLLTLEAMHLQVIIEFLYRKGTFIGAIQGDSVNNNCRQLTIGGTKGCTL